MASAVDEVWEDWKSVVNMTARELDKWLATDTSEAVGEANSEDGSADHRAGHRVVEILRSRKADLTAEDAELMREVVDYVRRRLERRPLGDVRESRWRYELMNRGHDPLKADKPPAGDRSATRWPDDSRRP